MGGETVTGWPDLFALTDGAKLDVVSVTRRATAPAAMSHLEDDIARIQKSEPGTIAGFTFFAWAPTPGGTVLQTAARALIDCGLAADRITFVFAQELVQTLLRDPQYGRLLVDELALHTHAFPFEDSQSRDLFSDEPGLFRPSRAEFESGAVHRPTAFTEARERLVSERFCVVLGRGAAGKTVLGAHMALSSEWARFYYLDLSDNDQTQAVPQALEVLSSVSQPGVLFIIDNAHLASRAALLLHDHWVRQGNGSSLLVLARFTSTLQDRVGGRPLSRLTEQAIHLVASPEDLGGIARRLLMRKGEAARVPDDALRVWEKTFGGDLVAFSLALQSRIEAGGLETLRRTWSLSYQDTLDYVHSQYIADASDSERESLFRIAALARYEIGVPPQALPHGHELSHTVKHGIVIESRHGLLGERRYTLVHPGLGTLISQAAGFSEEDLDALAIETAMNALPAALSLARRADGVTAQKVSALLRAKWSTPHLLDRMIHEAPLRTTALTLAGLVKDGVCSEADLDASLVSRADVLAQAIREGDPGAVNLLLAVLGKRRGLTALADVLTGGDSNLEGLVLDAALQGMWDTLAALVAANDTKIRSDGNQSLARLGHETERLLRTNRARRALSRGSSRVWSGDLSHFLDSLKRRPKTRASVLRALSRPEGLSGLRLMLVGRGIRAAAPLLARIVELDPDLAREVFRELDDEGIADLGRGLCSGRVDDLATLISLIERVAPEQVLALKRWLNSGEGREALKRCIVDTSIDGIVVTLDGKISVPDELNAALTELESEAGTSVIARVAGRSHVADLLRLVEVWPPGTRVINDINAETWHRQVMARRPENPEVFTRAVKALSQHGRSDLINALATAVVDRATPRQWSKAYFGPVANVLRFARDRSAEDKLRFMDRALEDGWLRRQYEHAGLGALAASLFNLWVDQPEAVIAWLADDSLADRLAREMRQLDENPNNIALFAQGYGAAGLFVDVPRWIFPSAALRPAIELILPTSPSKGLTLYELQILLGAFAAADLTILCEELPSWIARVEDNYRTVPLRGRSLLLKRHAIGWLSAPNVMSPHHRRTVLKSLGLQPAPTNGSSFQL